MTDQDTVYQQWLPVIGRSLAFLCVHAGDLKEESLGERAALLEALGVGRKEVAAMLGTTYASISETLSRVKRTKKGARKNGPKQKTSARVKKQIRRRAGNGIR